MAEPSFRMNLCVSRKEGDRGKAEDKAVLCENKAPQPEFAG